MVLDHSTELFAELIDARFNNPVLFASASAPSHNNRIPLPQGLKASTPRRSTHIPSLYTASHHLPASSPHASLFATVNVVDLPEIFSNPHTLILDIRPLPAYPIRCLTGPHVTSFFQWRLTRRILVYDADYVILRNGSNVLSLSIMYRMTCSSGLLDRIWYPHVTALMQTLTIRSLAHTYYFHGRGNKRTNHIQRSDVNNTVRGKSYLHVQLLLPRTCDCKQRGACSVMTGP